jgi:hypothetical protein
MFEDLKTPEQIEAFLAEQRRVLSEAEWRDLVHRLADEMAKRGDTPAGELLQRIGVYKRATDQLRLPSETDSSPTARAQARGWQVLPGGRSPTDPPGGHIS